MYTSSFLLDKPKLAGFDIIAGINGAQIEYNGVIGTVTRAQKIVTITGAETVELHCSGNGKPFTVELGKEKVLTEGTDFKLASIEPVPGAVEIASSSTGNVYVVFQKGVHNLYGRAYYEAGDNEKVGTSMECF